MFDPVDIQGAIEQRLRPMRELHEQLQAELTRLTNEANAVREQLRTVTAVLRAAEPNRTSGGRPSQNGKRKRDYAPSPASVERVYQHLLTAEEPQTRKEIEDATSISHETIGKALDILRNDGRVRLAGGRPAARGKPADLFTTFENSGSPASS